MMASSSNFLMICQAHKQMAGQYLGPTPYYLNDM